MSVTNRAIGGQGLAASSLGFGSMGLTTFYGAPTPDDQCMKVMKRCLELGVNLIDTAEIYRTDAGKITSGAKEDSEVMIIMFYED